MSITGLVLAGGKSSRMGTDKSKVLYKNKPLLEYAIITLKPVVSNIIISSNSIQPNEYSEYIFVKDIYTNSGPLAGIHAGIQNIQSEYVAVISCDTPLVPSEVFSLLIDNIQDYDAAVARHSSCNVEPLVAVYRTNILTQIENMLTAGNFKMCDFIQSINTTYVDFENSDMFFNCNYPKDLL